jgi:hypothetical protein
VGKEVKRRKGVEMRRKKQKREAKNAVYEKEGEGERRSGYHDGQEEGAVGDRNGK